MKQPTRATVCLSIALLTCVAGTSCFPKTKPATIETSSGQVIQARYARVWIYELADRLSGRIQLSANEIIKSSERPEVRRAALEWKANAIPAMQQASFHPDPVVALADMWLFVVQMEALMHTDFGLKIGGDHRMSFIKTLQDMENDVHESIRNITAEPVDKEIHDLIHSYAAANPIVTSISTRPTAAPALVDRMRSGEMGSFAAMGTLVEGFADLSDRLTIYGEQLPKQARWQAELLLWDKGIEAENIEELLTDVERVGRVSDRLVQFSDELPAMIDERIEELIPQLEELLVSIDVGNLETALEETATIHLAVALNAVTRERIAAINAVHEERLAAVGDAERVANEVVDRSFERVETIIDSALGRLVPLGIALMAGPFALGLLAGWILRRRGSDRKSATA